MNNSDPLPINNPAHWHQRAQEARELANQLNDKQAKIAMLRIAHEYERLAQRALARTRGRDPN